MNCFECGNEITGKYFTASYDNVFLHWSCVQQIINNHVKYLLDRDVDNTQRMEAEKLADKLGFS